jgi:predicted RNA-binding Zn ribbon-like protein
MNFTHYTDAPVRLAVDLVNTLQPVTGIDQLTDLAALRAFLRAHDQDARATASDLEAVRRLRADLREVFAAGDARAAGERINHVLDLAGATPRVSSHTGQPHLHFQPSGSGLAARIATAAAMGLAVVLCDEGAGRLGTCASASCQEAFVDMSKNRRKRFCSEACAHRESVAAFRARHRPAGSQP